MNILIADDNALNLKLLRAVLEAEGHSVYASKDGVEALSVLETEAIDAIISDILMPRMDGYRLCQEVRQNEALHQLPFIFYTATYTSPSDEGLALSVGADKYLRKPAPTKDLLAALHAVCSEPRVKEPPMAPLEDPAVMKEYNETLVRKLEEKNRDLESAQAEIMKANEALEERVIARTAELEAANEELEAFSHSAAHDLRAPLRAINGYCHLILEGAGDHLGDEGVDFLHRIRDASRKMNELIDELLKLSQIGRSQIEREVVDLSAIAQEIANELRDREPGRNIEFVIEPQIVIHGDEPLMRIALENLLSNASKFTSKSDNPKIEFGRRTGYDQNIFFIRDNGIGFSMDYVGKLFKPFERLHLQSEFPGTGLGLTIVQRIVARHGGGIWVESQPGAGATFFLKL